MPGAVTAEVARYAGLIDGHTDRIAAELAANAEALANAGTVEEVNTILAPTLAKLAATGKQPEVPPVEPPVEPPPVEGGRRR